MAVCKRCGKKGLFLHVNADGLCKKCIGQQEALLAGKKKAVLAQGTDYIKLIVSLYNSAHNYHESDDFDHAMEQCTQIRETIKKLSELDYLKNIMGLNIKYDSTFDRGHDFGKIPGLNAIINKDDPTYPNNIIEKLYKLIDNCEKYIINTHEIALKKAAFLPTLECIELYPIELSSEKIKKNTLSNIEDITFSSITKKSNYERLGFFTVVDVETTGLTASRDEIIEVAAIRFEEWIPICKFETFIKPKKEISPEITDINGITNDMVANAPSIQAVIPALSDFIGKSAIVGHNLLFDIKFLYKNGLDFFEVKRKYYDTLELARKILTKAKSSNDIYGDVSDHKLTTLCDYYSIRDNHYAHRAASDCLATGYLFNIFVKERIGIDE